MKDSRKEKVVNNFLVRLQSKAKYNNSPNRKGGELVIKKDKKETKNSTISFTKEELKKQIEETMQYMENISHFGLQSQHYSHTTSPIRRISDYVTHKNILAYLKGEPLIDEKTVLEIAQWANQMQDSVDQAEREFDDLNSAIYCENHIGEVMHGTICSFKKLKEGKDATADDIIVLVEDEAKGVKVQIPATEILPSGTKDVAISMYGSAIVNRSSSKPIVRLCENISFKVIKADRITREVTATTNLEKDLTIEGESFEYFDNEKIQANPQLSAKRQRMLNNVRYNADHVNSLEYRDETQEKRGKKHKDRVIKRTGVEEIDPKQAYIADKHDNIEYKKRKNKQIQQSYDEYDERF